MSSIQKLENISREEMLRRHRHGVGGTDVSVLFGECPWRTQLTMWMEKTDTDTPIEGEPKLEFEVGTALEQTVADLACARMSRKLNKEVRCHKTNFTYIKDGFKLANPDRIFYDYGEGSVILECKTTKWFNKDAWGSEDNPQIPRAYQHQINWYCGILQLNKAIIACLIGGSIDFVMREWVFDPELFAEQEKRAEKFWDLVTANIPPKAVGEDLQLLANTENKTYTLELPEEIIKEYLDIESDIKKYSDIIKPLEKKKADLKAEMVQSLNGYDGISRNYYIKNTPVFSKTIDTKRLKEEMPEVYEKYTVNRASYNKFTIKERVV